MDGRNPLAPVALAAAQKSLTARSITGIAAGTSGLAILLINVGTFALALKHQNASSSAANRITVPWAGDCVLAANGGAVVLVYDSTSTTWRVV